MAAAARRSEEIDERIPSKPRTARVGDKDRPSALLLLPDLSGGGAERTSLNLQGSLRRQGHAVRLCLLEARGEYMGRVGSNDYVLPRSRLLRALARRCPLDSPQRSLVQVPLLASILRREKPDVIMSSMADVTVPLALAFALMPWRRRTTRWIAREGNHTRVVMERAFPDPRLRRIVNRLIRWAYRSADACLAISDGVARGLVEDYDVDPSRLHVIPNPVDLDTLRADANRPAPTGLPKRFIAGVGRLDHQKGFDVLLEAFARLDDPDLELVLVGRGPEEGALKAQAEKLGVGNRVHFPGFVEHPAAIVSRAEVFCLSSRWEGFGHVIVEAMAVGCPVVVCDCEFGPAEIVDHGNTGLLIPPEDVDALVKALTRVLSNRGEAKRFAESARKRAEDFGSDRIAERYWELLSDTEENH